MNQLIPAAVILAGPLLLLAPMVYALRPQAGKRWLSTSPVAARRLLDGWAADREALKKAGLQVPGQFGDTTRPPMWTVPATDRDMTGSFPVVRAAA